MKPEDWDERYSTAERVWGAAPNVFVVEVLAETPPGRAVDLAAGEGRHAIWLAQRGWQVVAVDFSAAGSQRTREWAEAVGVADHVTAVTSDVTAYDTDEQFDLALLAYLQVPAEQRRAALNRAAEVLARGALLVVVAHDSANLAGGTGGPQDPAVLYTAEDVRADLLAQDRSWDFLRADRSERTVTGAEVPALDAVVVARLA